MTGGPSPGYSGTPLAKTLGIIAGTRLATRHASAGYVHRLEPVTPDVAFDARPTGRTDLVHLFVYRKSVLARELVTLRNMLPCPSASST